MKITSFSGKGKEAVFVGNVMELVEKIEKTGQNIQVDNLGESDFVVTYRAGKKKSLVWEWMKTACVRSGVFRGGVCHHDIQQRRNVTDVFAKLYEMIIGTRADGPTILERPTPWDWPWGFYCSSTISPPGRSRWTLRP